MTPTPCWYATRIAPSYLRAFYGKDATPDCSGPATHVVHDKRECLAVCTAHAEWRKTTSCAMGHARNCPNPVQPWKHVTEIT